MTCRRGNLLGRNGLAAPLVLAPPKVGRDMTPVWVAAAGVGGMALLGSVVLGRAALMRRRGQLMTSAFPLSVAAVLGAAGRGARGRPRGGGGRARLPVAGPAGGLGRRSPR